MSVARVTRALGAWGEDVAERHIERLGWTVLDRNWRCPRGELDLVARQHDGTVVFVEVKTRSGRGYGSPLEAVTVAKIAKLHEMAQWWLREHQVRAPRVRIDVIGVVREAGGVDVDHVRGVTR